MSQVSGCAMNAEWIRYLQEQKVMLPSGTRGKAERKVFKNKRSCREEKPFITVTRQKKLETLFARSKAEKKESDDTK